MLTDFVFKGSGTVTVGDTLIVSSSPGEGGFPPDSAGAAKMGLHRRYSNFRFLEREQWRLETLGDHERRHTCGGADRGVVSVLKPGEVGGPGGRETSCHTLQGRLQVLIGTLRLAVSLRVITRRQTGQGPQCLAKRLPYLG